MSNRSIVSRVEASVRSRCGLRGRWLRESLLGTEMVLRDGTLRPEPDYDDAWLYACLQHGEAFFDVGANVGQTALLALLCPSMKHVVLIDANWEALAVAADNLLRNGLSARARFVAAFASDKPDASVEFWTVGTGAAGSMFQTHAVTAAREGAVRKVSTTTLDEISRNYGIIPDVVKIDVEGAESQVLQGTTRCAADRRTRFLVEMHSSPELSMQRNAEMVLAWAASLDHAVWYLKGATRITSPEPIAKRGRCHLLLQPADWPYPEWLVGIPQSAPLPGA